MRREYFRLLGMFVCSMFLLHATMVLAEAAPEGLDLLKGAAEAIASTDRSTVITGIGALGKSSNTRALEILLALQEDRLQVDADGHLLIRRDTAWVESLSGDAIPAGCLIEGNASSCRPPPMSNAVRRALALAIAGQKLFSAWSDERLSAARMLAERSDSSQRVVLQRAVDFEPDPGIRSVLYRALAQIDLQSSDPETQLSAIRLLRTQGGPEAIPLLEQLRAQLSDRSAVSTEVNRSLSALHRREVVLAGLGHLFYGLSYASILLLASLGLAITFGLMGVINMAHGEMLMLGAYATYAVQHLFRLWLPQCFEWYLLAALPAAFFLSAGIGMCLERFIIRHLYGRPLETLLATWGISLILIQVVRSIFGAQNVQVSNPSWLSGGLVVASGLVLPYNRLAIIAFAFGVLLLTIIVFFRSNLGLQVRAVTQVRAMAACLGIHTGRVDLWTFGLGSGVAGLGGVALSQLGNVGPELGQSYIVDCFMVVVLGGVSNIAGTVLSAIGLGMVTKLLEPFAGAVLGKIGVLIVTILFIQQRPQGMFAMKGHAGAG